MVVCAAPPSMNLHSVTFIPWWNKEDVHHFVFESFDGFYCVRVCCALAICLYRKFNWYIFSILTVTCVTGKGFRWMTPHVYVLEFLGNCLASYVPVTQSICWLIHPFFINQGLYFFCFKLDLIKRVQNWRFGNSLKLPCVMGRESVERFGKKTIFCDGNGGDNNISRNCAIFPLF